MSQTFPVVLTIAGFDPSSGAGVTADIKTIAAHGCYGVACITALTVQSTQGARRVEAVSPVVIRATLQELISDFDIAAVHIGMLGTGEVAAAVADFLEPRKLPNVVLDPVLKSSFGADLLDQAGRKVILSRLFPLTTVITPNAAEAAVLTGLPVTNPAQMKDAAAKLHSMGAVGVVVTGGDLEATDLLSFAGKQEVFQAERLNSKSTHGTGCAFATAIACHLAQGRQLSEAVPLAKTYVAEAIAKAIPLGRGIGPIHHLYRKTV